MHDERKGVIKMSEGMEIGGVSLRHLAQTVGTPFFIYDEAMVENHLHTFRECLSHPELETQVVYAGKAFLCGKMARLVRDAGCGLDVVSGGEIPAALLADALVRLIPGALTDETSALSDSFQDNLLSPPVYTRPAEFNGWKVPEVLLSGNPKLIRQWQDEQALERTRERRPELLNK